MKPKVAFFDFASCEGCQLAILNCEEIFLDILNLINLVEFREALSETAPRYDIAFVEGSIHRDEDIERIQNIRSRTAYLVALGACACNGNVQARSNFVAPAVNYEVIYGEKARNRVQVDPDFWQLWAHTRVRPLDSIVKVDAYLRGCPPVPEEFLHLVKSLLQGTVPVIAPNAVCVDCKKNENECVLERGKTCMGPVTWAGCNSICVNQGYVCDGCRGSLPHANVEAHIALMREHKIDDKDIRSRYRLFMGGEPIGRGV